MMSDKGESGCLVNTLADGEMIGHIEVLVEETKHHYPCVAVEETRTLMMTPHVSVLVDVWHCPILLM